MRQEVDHQTGKDTFSRRDPGRQREASQGPSVGVNKGTGCYENRQVPTSKPIANAQRPNVQAEVTRTRLRRSPS
jgi:hypothetical protein